MKTIYKWKFLRLKDDEVKSNHGNVVWELNKWKEHKGNIDICNAGFHCSDKIYEAFNYVQGEILAKVEVRGDSEVENDKSVWSQMRIVEAYKWQKQDSVSLAIYAAELVIEIFEMYDSKDDRPRKAIEAAKKYLKNPTKENQEAAAESTVFAAKSFESAASAKSAASAAESATLSAASAAESATFSAAWSAGATSAAKSAKPDLIKKIDSWMNMRVKKLEVYVF